MKWIWSLICVYSSVYLQGDTSVSVIPLGWWQIRQTQEPTEMRLWLKRRSLWPVELLEQLWLSLTCGERSSVDAVGRWWENPPLSGISGMSRQEHYTLPQEFPPPFHLFQLSRLIIISLSIILLSSVMFMQIIINHWWK